MTSKTTYAKLKRWQQLGKEPSWYTNPNDHPHPTLPPQEELEDVYLLRVEGSTPPAQAEKVLELVAFVGKERQG